MITAAPESVMEISSNWPRVLSPGLVSIVMSAHNAELFLSESIESVQRQTHSNWELIFVDDASTDKTLSVAEEFAIHDPRIRIVRCANNLGVAQARNTGIAEARGQYLAFLDSDDLWIQEKLAIQVRFLAESDAGFCFGSYRRLTSDGRMSNPVQIPDRVTYDNLLYGNVIGCLTVLIDRTKIGPFLMPSVSHEDFAAWLSILKRGHVAHGIQQDLARYRVSSSSVSGKKWRAAYWTWNIYRKTERLPLKRAVACFFRYVLRSAQLRYTT
jgi:teichuronic acid biosynthesis glycosyltransferase TuaG